MRRWVVLSAVLGASLDACSSTDVSVDYDPKVDFSKLRTWAWSVEGSGAGRPEKPDSQEASPLTLQRAKAAIEAALSAKGYRPVAPDQADMLVSVHFAIARRLDYYYPDSAYYPGHAGWGWGYGWGPYWDGYWGAPAVYATPESVLILDILEPNPAKRLIWRGVARGPTDSGLAPEEREARIQQEVQEVLSGFPPGGVSTTSQEKQASAEKPS